MTIRTRGEVKFLKRDENSAPIYGFISVPNGRDVYFPAKVVAGNVTLKSGDRVEFESLETQDGRVRATYVGLLR
jgi:cold shock CspA family protein